MTPNQALQRILWRFTSGKSFTANDKDIQALNALINFVNDTNSNFARSNVAFTKLFIFSYSILLREFNCSIYDTVAEKRLSKLLSAPLDILVKRFTENINSDASTELMKDLEIVLDHPALLSDQDKKENAQKIKKFINDHPDRINEVFDETFKEEDIKDNLISMAANAYIKFNNED